MNPSMTQTTSSTLITGKLQSQAGCDLIRICDPLIPVGRRIQHILVLHYAEIRRLPAGGAVCRRGAIIGGAEGNRTPDLLNAIQALSQLSYGPDR
jgi:hypothetical protein